MSLRVPHDCTLMKAVQRVESQMGLCLAQKFHQHLKRHTQLQDLVMVVTLFLLCVLLHIVVLSPMWGLLLFWLCVFAFFFRQHLRGCLFGNLDEEHTSPTTIVLGKGKHQIEGDYLDIHVFMNIVGQPGVPKEEIIVVGGIRCDSVCRGNVHLQNMTLRSAKKSGVWGQSSFTMTDVIVERCCESGVVAWGTAGACTNVNVRQCGKSGVLAGKGGSMTLIGASTKVHQNCTTRNYPGYVYPRPCGLALVGSSTIHLVSPLTKETVSINNTLGHNWGARKGGNIDQIKTVARRPYADKMTKNND